MIERFPTIPVSLIVLLTVGPLGCGTTRDKLATEQLLMSDAVDRAVARIDFKPLAGESVFLDTTYITQIKGTTFANADYIISSLRQQMVLAGCRLQDDRAKADYVAEARVGTLGRDAYDVNYGVPGNQGLSAAASLVATIPLPSLPEISLARQTDEMAATKIAVFAYHRDTQEPAWQSGVKVATSKARAKWVLGAGPFRSGSIYDDRLDPELGQLTTSPLEKAKGRDPSPEDDDYRGMFVWRRELQAKLRPGESAEHLAAETESSSTPLRGSTTDGDQGVQRAEFSSGVPQASGEAEPQVPADPAAPPAL